MTKPFTKLAVSDDFFEINVRAATGKVRKRVLPRIGWEELNSNLWVLSKTSKWLKPLYVQRRVERGVVLYNAYEGEKR